MKNPIWANPSNSVAILDAKIEAAEKFGSLRGADVVPLKKCHIDALLAGKVLAWDAGDHSTFILLEQDEAHS